MKRLSSPKEDSDEESVQIQPYKVDFLHETGKKKENPSFIHNNVRNIV